MSLEHSTVISVLSTALIHAMDIASDSKIQDCKAVGLIHSTVSKTTSIVETWLIKFDTETCKFSIHKVMEPEKYEDGMVLYWYTTDENEIVKTNLFGDKILDEDALNGPPPKSEETF
jgi:hypothetical protein